MPSALQLIEKLVIDKLVSVPAPLSGVEKTRQFFYVLSAFFLATGLVFLVYGAHSWLSVRYPADVAAIVTGIISIALSVMIAGTLFAVIHYYKTRIKRLRQNITDKIKSSLSTLETELEEPIRDYPKTALVIASFLGFLAEDQFFDAPRTLKEKTGESNEAGAV